MSSLGVRAVSCCSFPSRLTTELSSGPGAVRAWCCGGFARGCTLDTWEALGFAQESQEARTFLLNSCCEPEAKTCLRVPQACQNILVTRLLVMLF